MVLLGCLRISIIILWDKHYQAVVLHTVKYDRVFVASHVVNLTPARRQVYSNNGGEPITRIVIDLRFLGCACQPKVAKKEVLYFCIDIRTYQELIIF